MRRLALALTILFATACSAAVGAAPNVIAIDVKAPGVPEELEELEESITQPIEKALYLLAGLMGMRSSTSYGQVRVELTYASNPTPDDVMQVMRAFASVRGLLPTSASEPLIEVQASVLTPR